MFSGTGNLAIECISRGAIHVDIVKNNRKSLAIIRENLGTLKITEGFKIFPIDAFKFIKEYTGAPYDVVLCDPPFTRSWAHDLAEAIAGSNLLGAESRLVIESASKEKILEAYPGLNRLDQRHFGDKYLNFFAKS